MIRKNFIKLGAGLFWGVLLCYLVGCGQVAPLDVADAFQEDTIIETFYGEITSKAYIKNELVEKGEYKEWKGKDNQYHNEVELRVERTFFEENYKEELTEKMLDGEWVVLTEEDTINNEQLIAYFPYNGKYSIKSMTLADRVKGNIRVGIHGILAEGSLKDYVMDIIDEYEDDFHLSVEDDVKLNNYLTQHIIADSKAEGTQNHFELWIDQETWHVVKYIESSGEYAYEQEYTKYEINPKIDETIFEVDIPEDAQIEYLYDNLESLNEEVTLDEGIEYLGMPIFYLEIEDAQLISTRYIESVDNQYGRVELTYKTAEGSEFIVRNSPASIVDEKMNLGYEKIDVRGIQADYVETNSGKCIEFVDHGIICDLYIKNSTMSKEEMVYFANQLILREQQK